MADSKCYHPIKFLFPEYANDRYTIQRDARSIGFFSWEVKKIEITLSEFYNNLINSNCEKSSNLLIIKNCTFFICIVNFTFTWCDY